VAGQRLMAGYSLPGAALVLRPGARRSWLGDHAPC